MKAPKSVFPQFVYFASAGAVATAAHYAVLITLVEAFEVYAVTASVAGYLVGLVIGYLLNYHFTFNSRQKHWRAFSRFLAVALTGLALNVFIVKVAFEQLGLHYVIAQIAATAVVLMWNFCGSRFWSFRDLN